jgi:acetolactate synthase I/II/III large subunit
VRIELLSPRLALSRLLPGLREVPESFEAKGNRVQSANELAPILKEAIASDTVAIIDCPLDYSENMKLTERLEHLVRPV